MAAGIPFCAASVMQRAISFHSASNKDPALINTICLRSSSRRFSSIRSSIQLTLHLYSGKDEKLGSNPAHLFLGKPTSGGCRAKQNNGGYGARREWKATFTTGTLYPSRAMKIETRAVHAGRKREGGS